MLRFSEEKAGFFSKAKKIAKERVKNLIPNGWNYKIKSYKVRYLVNGAYQWETVWSIHFFESSCLDKNFYQWIEFDFYVCAEDFYEEKYSYVIRGNTNEFNGRSGIEIRERLKGLQETIDKIKICVKKIVEVVNPDNFN